MMKALFERSRELSKLGFAVSLPIAGYLAVNPNLPSSSSSENADSRAAGRAASHVSAAGGRNLKDEIHIHENEEALANIIHVNSSTTNTTLAISAIKDHPQRSKKLFNEEGFLLSPLKQLPLQHPESSLMRLTHTELEANEVEMEQVIESIREREHGPLIDYYGSKNKQVAVREIEDQLKINMLKVKSLSLKIQSLNEDTQLLRIQDSEYSGAIGELESVIMVINGLIRALKSALWHSNQKMAVLEDNKNDEVEANTKLIMGFEDEDNSLSKIKLSAEQKNSEPIDRLELEDNVASSGFTPKVQEVEELDANSSIEENENEREINLPPDDNTAEIQEMQHFWEINTCFECDQRIESSTDEAAEICTSESISAKSENKYEQKNSELIDRLGFETNIASSCCSPKGQEVEEELESNHSIEENQEEREIEHQSDDHDEEIVKMLNVCQVNPCSKCEQRVESSTKNAAESCKKERWNDNTEKKSKHYVIEYANLGIDQRNRYQRDFDTGNFSSQQIRNEPMSCSSDTSSMTSNCSVVRSKHQSSRRKKVFSKLKRMFLGKHNGNKGTTIANETHMSSANSDTHESVSSSCLDDDDDVRRNSFDSDLACFSEELEYSATKHLLETKPSGERWKSNTAWCQSCFRSPFEVPQTKIFAVQDEDISALGKGNQRKPAHGN
ncbi:hypothetical protein Cni_G07322 [Canna indica]|uniref:Uncharacterized protein n=1 Tax=Canna indica TaxID=4628 RepID=A0AAQ3Q4T0_9LILI|nr:hypothetical protein Cni_G07322 [Canna indica]